MNFNRKFIPNVWENPRPVHPIPPFANNQQNFFQNQGNFQHNQNFNQNFHQSNQNQIRPLLSLPTADHAPPFRKFNNNNNNHPDYRRPGPAFTRNNYQGNNSQKWNKNHFREDFNNREPFENQNNNNNRFSPLDNSADQNPSPGVSDSPKFPSLVEQLRAVQNAKKIDSESCRSEIDAICAKNASGASKKLLTQLKTMDKDGVKDLINNPKQPYKKKVLNLQAREKLREQMRKKLKVLGADGDEYPLEPDECIDYEKLPDTLIAQIGKTIDMNLEIEDMDLSESINEEIMEDRDIEVVKQNLGQDFLMGSEMLLMNGFSLLAETDNESEFKALDESIPRLPPLPAENHDRPPSPPPEPVPPIPDPVRLPMDKAVFSSADKPWSPIRKVRPSFAGRFVDEDWDIESAKNPDPPPFNHPSKTPFVPHESTPKEDEPAPVEKVRPVEKVTPVEKAKPVESAEKKASDEIKAEVKVNDDEWDIATKVPSDDQKTEQAQPADSSQRSNETYGEYRRRLDLERKKVEPEVVEEKAGTSISIISNSNNNVSNNNNNRPPNEYNRFQPRSQQNQRKPNDWNNDDKNSGHGNARNANWKSNNRQNDTRNSQNESRQHNRKSRYEMDRGRDRSDGNFQRNTSRDTNNLFDSGRHDRFDDVKDVHNYRFKAEKESQEPDIERLTSILNPKPLQFKGSFNVRSQNASCSGYNQRAGRNRTPVNNSMEREFDESLLPLPNDARPCLTTLRKVMEIDAEITKLHEKIHGIDKVISNLQSERIGYQKSFSSLQHDRKILFDNLMKRAMSNSDAGGEHQRDKSNSRDSMVASASQTKLANEKRLQNIVDQKKRKHEEQVEEPKKKKPAVEVMETTSAAAKAEQRRKEKEEEERRQKLVEKKRLKTLRREREEAEKARLEEKIRREAAASTTITIKQEPRDKSVDRTKSGKSSGKIQKAPEKTIEPIKILFKQSEILQVIESYKVKMPRFMLPRVALSQNLIDTFKSTGSLEVNIDDWNKWCSPVKLKPKVKKEVDKPAKAKSPETTDPLAIPEFNEDPLGVDDTSMNPLTPGSNLTNDDEMLIEIQTEQDYSEWSGNFTAHESPIVHLCNINGKFVVAASEDGKVFKYHLRDGKLAAVFSKHTEICNSFLYDDKGSIYTVSSDGFLHKIKFKTFALTSSENFNEPLQVIERSKAGVYVGAKSGRIYRLKPDLTERDAEPICDVGALILCMRALKEGSRNILLVSSRANAIQVRDASDGLLLRTLSNELVGLSIYDVALDGSTIYCGSNQNSIFAVDFTTGALKKSRPCGAGAICVKLFKHYLIAACYDGNIYIFNTKNDDDAVNICGPANMLLSMDLWDNKIIASTKDKTMKIMNIPT